MPPKSKLHAAPIVSMIVPATVGPNAMPQVAPALSQVMASVSRSPGTARSQVALATMRNGAYANAAIVPTRNNDSVESMRIIVP